MEDSLIAMLFAEDLMEFVLNTVGHLWPCGRRLNRFRPNFSRLPYDRIIFQAVSRLIALSYNEISACYQGVRQKWQDSAMFIGFDALRGAPNYFPHGYSVASFLAYCAMVVGVCIHFYSYPSNGVVEVGSQLIGLVLIGHMLTKQFQENGGWEHLARQSRLFYSRTSRED